MVNAPQSRRVVVLKVDLEVSSTRNLVSIHRDLHGVDAAAPGALPGGQAAHHLGRGRRLGVLEEPVLVHRGLALQGLKIIVEPDLVSENWIVKIEIISSKSRAIEEDDTSPFTDGGWFYPVDCGSCPRSFSCRKTVGTNFETKDINSEIQQTCEESQEKERSPHGEGW